MLKAGTVVGDLDQHRLAADQHTQADCLGLGVLDAVRHQLGHEQAHGLHQGRIEVSAKLAERAPCLRGSLGPAVQAQLDGVLDSTALRALRGAGHRASGGHFVGLCCVHGYTCDPVLAAFLRLVPIVYRGPVFKTWRPEAQDPTHAQCPLGEACATRTTTTAMSSRGLPFSASMAAASTLAAIASALRPEQPATTAARRSSPRASRGLPASVTPSV